MDTPILSQKDLPVISREQAKELGLKFFFTGKLCRKGHIAQRRVCNGDCIDCTKKPPRVTRICAVDGCDKKSRSHGYCLKHLWRFLQHGDPLAGGVDSGSRLKWLEDNKNHRGDECLIFPFGKNKWYPTVLVDGKCKSAHSVMNRLANGEKPSDKHLSGHACGNGGIGCVNPSHLRWYTHVENAADRHVHGTALVGERCPKAILTESQVKEIKALRGAMTQQAIADMFGVKRGTVKAIFRGITWKHIP